MGEKRFVYMVKEKVEYVSDPRGNDIWEPANVTLRIGAGDCEDQAILLSSMATKNPYSKYRIRVAF